MNKEIVRRTLESGNYCVVLEKRYKNTAWKFKLSNGTSVFCGDSEKLWTQGKQGPEILTFLNENLPPIENNKVFIVYGRDVTTKNDLIDMLKSWGLEALTIDNLPVQGRTIIEQLEHYIPQANYGIVLATPDDIGYLDGHETDAKYRARQNVVLELGMLFSKLGRKRVAVILKKSDDFERPSDIDGVLYLQFEKNIAELGPRLIRELNTAGYAV